jgi:TonB family protein
MKQIIKIMKTKPVATDKEIQSFMDFERLLEMHKQGSVSKAPRSFRILWITSAIVLLGMATFLVVMNADPAKESNETKNENIPVAPLTKDSAQNQNGVIESQTIDSSESEVVQSPSATKLKDNKPQNNSSSKTEIKSPLVEESESNEAFVKPVYVQAEPVEGYPHLYAYFNAELKYPQEAMKDSIRGEVIAEFTISSQGIPEKIGIEQSLGPLFDREVIRLITNMPAWKPATYKNKPVASKMSLPLTFQLKKIK